jgi:serine O-acetyltransferase
MILFQLMNSDIKAKALWLYGSDSRGDLAKALLTDGTFAMLMYRFMQACHKKGLFPLTMLFNKLITWFGGCVIGRGADFGPGFVLIHAVGVVINTNVQGGSHVYLEHQVTIGAEKGMAPVLGNHIFVGAGAKILGPVKVGDQVRVGANAVVLEDVPDNATCVGVPAKNILKEKQN